MFTDDCQFARRIFMVAFSGKYVPGDGVIALIIFPLPAYVTLNFFNSFLTSSIFLFKTLGTIAYLV